MPMQKSNRKAMNRYCKTAAIVKGCKMIISDKFFFNFDQNEDRGYRLELKRFLQDPMILEAK